MKIGQYEHGRSIFMSLSDEESLPKGFVWFPICIAISAVIILFIFPFEFVTIATSGFFVLVAFLVYIFFRPKKYIVIADINRGYHDFVLVIRGRNRKIKEHIIPFDKVRSIVFRHERKSFSENDIRQERGKNLSVEMVMVADLAKETTINGLIEIDGLDLREEMLDFAKRFANIMEMSCGHMVLNDPQKCEMKFFQKNMDNLENKIDIHDVSEHPNLENAYKANRVKKDEIIDKIVCEEWDHKKHRLTAKLIEYKPKSNLSLEYQHSKLGQIFLYILFYVIVSVVISCTIVIFMLLQEGNNIDYMPTALWGGLVVGVVLALLHYAYRVSTGYFQAVNWNFDLKNKTLKITQGFKDAFVDLKNVKQVTLYRVQTFHTRTSGGKNHRAKTYYCYNGIVALSGDGIPEFFVGETGKIESNEDRAYSDGLTYANIFIKALDVPLVFCERGGEIRSEEYYHGAFLKEQA